MSDYITFAWKERRFLSFGLAMTFFSSLGQTFFIGQFGKDIRGEFDLTDGQYGGIYSGATLASGVCLIWLGHLIDHFDLRRYTMFVCIGLVVAAIVMGLAPAVPVLFLALFLLRQFGQGLMGHTAMTSMARYFDASRGKAMSIAGLGYSLGEAVFPASVVLLTAWITWRAAWFVFAALAAITLIPGAWWLLHTHGERHARHMHEESLLEQEVTHEETVEAVMEAQSGSAVSRRPHRARSWTRSEVLGDWRFYLMLPAILAPGFIITGVFFHQDRIVDLKGWSEAAWAVGFIIFAVVQLPALVVAGWLIDRISAMRLLPLFVIPLALATLCLALSDHLIIVYAFFTLAGLTVGVASTVIGAMWAERYGVGHVGSIRAMASALGVFATAGSPALMGWLIDRNVSIEAIALSFAIYAVVGIVLAAVSASAKTLP